MRRMRWVPPWRSLVLAVVAMVIAAAPGAPSLLAWYRQAIQQGDLWRLWTGHLVHASGYHLLWNLLPLIGLGLLWEPVLGRRYWSLLGISAATVSVGLFLLDPSLTGYVGLSGILNGLWLGGALLAARQQTARGDRAGRFAYSALASLGLIKLAVETVTGTPLFTDDLRLGARAVPLAHGLGALGAVVWLATVAVPRRIQCPGEPPQFTGGDRRDLSPVARRLRAGNPAAG